MTRFEYLERRSKLVPEFQKKWDKRKGVTFLDRFFYRRLTTPPKRRKYREWQGLTVELMRVQERVLMSYSVVLLSILVVVIWIVISITRK